MKKIYAKQQRGHDDNDSDSKEEESWKRGMNQTEQMHLLASAGINTSEDSIAFIKDDLQRYKKQAKRYFKNKS